MFCSYRIEKLSKTTNWWRFLCMLMKKMFIYDDGGLVCSCLIYIPKFSQIINAAKTLPPRNSFCRVAYSRYTTPCTIYSSKSSCMMKASFLEQAKNQAFSEVHPDTVFIWQNQSQTHVTNGRKHSKADRGKVSRQNMKLLYECSFICDTSTILVVVGCNLYVCLFIWDIFDIKVG